MEDVKNLQESLWVEIGKNLSESTLETGPYFLFLEDNVQGCFVSLSVNAVLTKQYDLTEF